MAIVTGTGSGVGKAAAARLASEGALVACLDHRREALERTVGALITLGGQVIACHCDASDERQVLEAVDHVAGQLGRPSVLCNATAAGGFFHSADMPLSRWNQMLAANLTAPFLLIRAALPFLLHPLGGAIVNVVAAAGLTGSPYSAGYCASQGGLVMLTKALAVEYAERNVRINAVAAGGIEAEADEATQLPEGVDPKHLPKMLNRTGSSTPEEVASAVVFLASDEARSITGAVLAVDGGLSA